MLLALGTASAEVVDQQRAATIAGRWLGGEASLCWESPRTKADSDPLFYVFSSEDGGWVMISAEDATCPILAYSDEGQFNGTNLPDGLKAWLNDYAKSIREARKYSVQADANTARMWQVAGYRTKASGGKLLETAKWGQYEPYNLLCPEVTEGGKTVRALTGCVATAMAIVCRFHQWPEKGKGTVGGYSYKSEAGQTVNIPSYSIDEHEYNYSLMPLRYTSSANSSQKNAVAQLMHDCGVMVEAGYNYSYGTWAYSDNLCNALFKHLSYSGNARLEIRSEYNDVEWIQMIKNEIDADRPLLYGGVDEKQGGHQFVCDGYDANDYVHINWGWEGVDDGYFTLMLSIPGDCTFNTWQDMVVGLEPDRDGSTTTAGGPVCFLYQYSTGEDYKGITLNSGDVMSKSFSVKLGYLFNQHYHEDYNGAVRVALVDKDGALKEVISDVKPVFISAANLTGISRLSCKITVALDYGDAVILQYKDRDESWKKVRSYTDYGSVNSELLFIDAPFIKLADSYKASDRLYFELSETGKCISSITWTFDGTKQEGVCVDLSSGTHTLEASVSYTDGSTDLVSATITVQ